MSFFHFLVAYPVLIGVAAALIFIGVRMTYVPADRKRCDWFLAAAALALPANMLSESTALLLSRLRPFKLDEYIFQLDGLLGFQPSFAIGRVLADHLWLKVISSMAYSVLPCAVLVVFGLYLWQRTAAETLTVLRTFLLNLFFAVPLYLLPLPVGRRSLLRDFHLRCRSTWCRIRFCCRHLRTAFLPSTCQLHYWWRGSGGDGRREDC